MGSLLLIALMWYLGFSNLVSQFSSLDPIYVVMAAMFVATATIMGAVNVYLLFAVDGRAPSFGKFLPVYWVSWGVGLIFPGQIGDLASLAVLLKRRGLELHLILGRSFADKVISLVLMSIFGFLGILLWADIDLMTVCVWLSALSVALLIPALMRARLVKWASSILPNVVNSVEKSATEFFTLVGRHPHVIAINMGITVLKILLAGGAYWCVFSALGHDELSYWMIVLLAAASSLVAYLPISLNGVGTAEAAGIYLFSKMGLLPATVLTAYLALRIVVLGLAWLPVLAWASFTWHKDAAKPFGKG